MRNKLIVFVLLLALALGFSVVSAQESPLGVDAAALEGLEIVYWHQYTGGANLDTINALIEEFNATNEYGIVVTGIAQGNYGDLRQLMTAGIASGELPDLVAGYQNDMATYWSAGRVVDLMPYYSDPVYGYSATEQADFNQGILNVNVFSEYGGAMLGWPNQISANVLSVNMGMLEALGFSEPPTTVEDFIAVACAAANSDLTGVEGQEVRGYPIKTDASNFESYAASFGGYIFDYDANQYSFTNPGALAAFQMYADLYSQGCAYIPESAFGNTDDFAFGLNPMALGSSAGIPFIIGNIDSSASGVSNWTVTTTPWTEGSRALNVFVPSLIAVSSTPEEQVATWLFVKYLASPEAMGTWISATGYFPVRLSVAADYASILPADAPQTPYLTTVNNLLADPNVTVYSSPRHPSYNTVRGLLQTAMTDVTVNGRDVMEVAAELEAASNAALAEQQ